MASGKLIRRNSEILMAGVGEETILLDLSEGTYVALNETAARIWGLLEEPRSHDDIVGALMADYDIDPTACDHEVAEFVRGMSDRHLLIVEPAA
jgi:hypothetical protein